MMFWQWLSPASPEWLILGLVLLTLIAVRRARNDGKPASGFKTFVIIVLGLCTLIALMTAYARGKNLVKPQHIAERGRKS